MIPAERLALRLLTAKPGTVTAYRCAGRRAQQTAWFLTKKEAHAAWAGRGPHGLETGTVRTDEICEVRTVGELVEIVLRPRHGVPIKWEYFGR